MFFHILHLRTPPPPSIKITVVKVEVVMQTHLAKGIYDRLYLKKRGEKSVFDRVFVSFQEPNYFILVQYY